MDKKLKIPSKKLGYYQEKLDMARAEPEKPGRKSAEFMVMYHKKLAVASKTPEFQLRVLEEELAEEYRKIRPWEDYRENKKILEITEKINKMKEKGSKVKKILYETSTNFYFFVFLWLATSIFLGWMLAPYMTAPDFFKVLFNSYSKKLSVNDYRLFCLNAFFILLIFPIFCFYSYRKRLMKVYMPAWYLRAICFTAAGLSFYTGISGFFVTSEPVLRRGRAMHDAIKFFMTFGWEGATIAFFIFIYICAHALILVALGRKEHWQ